MSEAVPSPAVAGFWKPVLLLNEGFGEGLSDEESDLVLSHELAHIRRGDLPLNALLCALLASHWFNPFLWLAFLRARADREAACDAHVLRGESAARCATYGHTLLKMETSLSPRGLALGFVGLLPKGHSLRSRIQTIISQPKTNKTMKIAAVLSITVLAFAGLAKADKPLQPKDIAPAEFKAHFARVDSPESMRSTEFQGIENGKATIAVSKMNPLTQKFSKQLVTVKLADLDPALRAEIEAYWAKKRKVEKAPGTAHAEKATDIGDGKAPDKGRPARVFTNSDFLDLGQIDLNLNKKYEFNLEGLPNAGFLAGLAIEPHYVIDPIDLTVGVPVWEAPAWFKDVQVKMTLTDVATNKTVFEIDQDLGKFTAGTVDPDPGASPVAAVIPGQSPRFLFFTDGTVSTPEVGRFTPAKDQKFRLTLEIKSAINKALPASLMVTAQEEREPTQEDYNKALAKQLEISKLRHATLDAADRNKIPHLREFLALYPDSVVRYMSLTGANFPSLSVTTTLHDRYEFRMDVPVKYSDDHLEIVSYGEPACYLIEVAAVTPREDGAGGIELGGTRGGDLQKDFGSKEWGALVESKGDFSVLGYEIKKGKPVPNFNLVIKHLRSFERRITNHEAEDDADQPATAPKR